MNSTNNTARLDHLRYNVLCETLTAEEFAGLNKRLQERHFAKGDVIMMEDSNGDELFLIASGRVSILRAAGEGTALRLAVLHAGDFFGELELIDGRPRSARVIAEDPCVLYTLKKADFDLLTQENNHLVMRLLQVVAVRLRAMNNHVVKELTRARLIARKELSTLEQLIEASKNLNSTLDLEEVLDRILETALRIVDADRGTVYLLDETRKELWSRVLSGNEHFDIRLSLGKGIAGYVAATGDTLNIPDAYVDARFNPDVDRQSGYHTETILCMPMRNNAGRIIGVFQLLNKHSGTFTSEDEELLGSLSIHAAIAVENARLYQQERDKLKLEKSVLAAREVQMTLLPQELPVYPGMEFSASTTPAEEVGGDMYDFLTLPDGTIAVCLGDVSGKGLPASLLMANMQATVRAQSVVSLSAADCLRRVNRSLYRSTSPEKFVTAFYGIISRDDNTLLYASAGHEPAIHLHSDGSIDMLTNGGIMLGVRDDFVYDDETVSFEPGDVVVIFSDGITEAIDGEGGMYGVEPLKEVLRTHRQESAERIRLSVLDALRQFIGSTRQSDDITLVVVKRAEA